MVVAEHKRIFNEIDEIDHLTLRFRRSGRLSASRAAALLRRYRALDADVAQALDLSDEEAAEASLLAMDPQTLHDLLVRTRTVLMKKAGLGE